MSIPSSSRLTQGILTEKIGSEFPPSHELSLTVFPPKRSIFSLFNVIIILDIADV